MSINEYTQDDAYHYYKRCERTRERKIEDYLNAEQDLINSLWSELDSRIAVLRSWPALIRLDEEANEKYDAVHEIECAISEVLNVSPGVNAIDFIKTSLRAIGQCVIKCIIFKVKSVDNKRFALELPDVNQYACIHKYTIGLTSIRDIVSSAAVYLRMYDSDTDDACTSSLISRVPHDDIITFQTAFQEAVCRNGGPIYPMLIR
jgi:hypothetical protein